MAGQTLYPLIQEHHSQRVQIPMDRFSAPDHHFQSTATGKHADQWSHRLIRGSSGSNESPTSPQTNEQIMSEEDRSSDEMCGCDSALWRAQNSDERQSRHKPPTSINITASLSSTHIHINQRGRGGRGEEEERRERRGRRGEEDEGRERRGERGEEEERQEGGGEKRRER
ncbi:unnamed protein product [Pleuronectes platessa]|uniref:Uncharacterized protein n=1 Tax=Pleuronectes platessa TaxID=8262 RepID=A0A9N7YLN1_PLEPL|nr:unnamed protein product [Pleuronectes platessa]